jgi:hypothetical protein
VLTASRFGLEVLQLTRGGLECLISEAFRQIRHYITGRMWSLILVVVILLIAIWTWSIQVRQRFLNYASRAIFCVESLKFCISSLAKTFLLVLCGFRSSTHSGRCWASQNTASTSFPDGFDTLKSHFYDRRVNSNAFISITVDIMRKYGKSS